MKPRFSREQAEAVLKGDVGYEFCLARSFAEAKAVGGLASSGDAFINVAVKCFLVEYDDPGRRLLARAEEWLEVAIEADERPRHYFPNGTEAQRLYNLALCRWLARDLHDTESLRQAIDCMERYFDAAKVDRVELTLVSPEYIDAARIGEASRRAQQAWGTAKLPLELQVALAMASAPPEDPARQEKIDRLLRARMSEWLVNGHFSRAAAWLKVTRWLPAQSRSAISFVIEAPAIA